MILPRKQTAIRWLQWLVGVIVFVESARLAFEAGHVAAFARTGFPRWIRSALSVPEMAGAVLFLIPRTLFVGGYTLLAVFAAAILVHLLHGRLDVTGVLLYAAAVIAVMAHQEAEGKS